MKNRHLISPEHSVHKYFNCRVKNNNFGDSKDTWPFQESDFPPVSDCAQLIEVTKIALLPQTNPSLVACSLKSDASPFTFRMANASLLFCSCVNHTPTLRLWIAAMKQDPTVCSLLTDKNTFLGFLNLYFQNNPAAFDYGLSC